MPSLTDIGTGLFGLGALGTGVAGIANSLGQQTQQPFTTQFTKVPDAAQSAYMTGAFGTQGNYNPNALLPTNGSTGGFQLQNQQQGGMPQSQIGGQQQTFQQQNQAASQPGFNAGQAFTQMFNDPNVTLNYGQPQDLQSAVSQGGQGLQNYVAGQAGTNPQMGGYNQIPFNNNLGLNKNMGQAEAAGYNPYQDQLNMQSSGLANTGQGFQNIQNSQNAQGQMISQGANLANQGQQQYQTGAGNLQNTIGQNAGQFQNYFNQMAPTLGQAGQYTSQAAGLAGYSPQTISQAYGLAGQASGLAGQVPGDLDMARQFALQDRAQRGGLINQGTGTGLDQTSLNIADQIRQSSLQSAISNITGGSVADQFANQVSAAQANAASRGLGIGSSPVISAQGQVQKERDRLLAEAQNQANSQYQQSLLALRGQQQQNALSGAGLLNQSSMSSQGQLASLIGAGANAINAGSGALNAATGAQSAGGNILNQAAQNQIAQAGQQANAGQLLLAGQGQQQGAMQNLLNSGLQANQIGTGALSNFSQNANQAGQLGVAQGQLGLQTQGQGYDQVLAMLDALMQQKNNQDRNKFANAASAAGAQFSS